LAFHFAVTLFLFDLISCLFGKLEVFGLRGSFVLADVAWSYAIMLDLGV